MKNTTRHPYSGNELVQLIRMVNSIQQKWVNIASSQRADTIFTFTNQLYASQMHLRIYQYNRFINLLVFSLKCRQLRFSGVCFAETIVVKAELCDDASHVACQILYNSKPDMCNETGVASIGGTCPKTCGKCRE